MVNGHFTMDHSLNLARSAGVKRGLGHFIVVRVCAAAAGGTPMTSLQLSTG